MDVSHSKAAIYDYFHCRLICWLFSWLRDSLFGLSNVRKRWKCCQCFPKSKITSSNVLVCAQPKDIKLTVIEDEKKTGNIHYNPPQEISIFHWLWWPHRTQDKDSETVPYHQTTLTLLHKQINILWLMQLIETNSSNNTETALILVLSVSNWDCFN